MFRETRALEKKCLELATNRNGKNKNSGGHLNEHSRTITELSVLSQELAREEMMTRKRCEDVEKERDLLRLELVSVQAELKAMKEEISRAHERDINYMMSSSGGKVPKGLTYHNEQQLPQQPLQPPPPLQEQTEMKGVGVEATPGFGFFQTTQPATGRVLQFEKENVSVPLVNESVLPSNLETTATETTGTTTTTPRADTIDRAPVTSTRSLGPPRSAPPRGRAIPRSSPFSASSPRITPSSPPRTPATIHHPRTVHLPTTAAPAPCSAGSDTRRPRPTRRRSSPARRYSVVACCPTPRAPW